ncbi:anthranilate phosphoribosyltransferase [Ceratobasidium sp. 370]|nr:anthranilate phosphoribosyltransferase [Ceratobasidium sp. 370]
MAATSTTPAAMSSDTFKPLLLKLINTPGKFSPEDTKLSMRHLATPGCHGNKASTSSSGSADILLALGCPLTPPPPSSPPLPNAPFTFLLAAHHHPALTALAPIRKALPFRTVFNVLGPLVNPAKPSRMILGVYARELGPVFAEALRGMGVQRALVVCGMESLDEISIAGGTWAWSLENGDITTTTLHPSHFELQTHPLSTVAGASPEANAQILTDMLDPSSPSFVPPTSSAPPPIITTSNSHSGTSGSLVNHRAILDFVLLNASALLVVAGLAPDYPSGVRMARESIASGRAWAALQEFKERDQARMNGREGGAKTEESIFAVVARMIWKNVKGPEKLFRLIEGVTINESKATRDITLPEPLSDGVLQRFRLYAPFVRSLDIFGARLCVISNWGGLFGLSSSSPLLPNVQSLTLTSPNWFLGEQHLQLPLLLMFLSPSLVEYRVPYTSASTSLMITGGRFAAILSALQRRCPNLETLMLFRSRCSDSIHDDLPLVPQGYMVSEYFSTVNLRTLSTSLSVLKEIDDLHAISQIERLEIYGPSRIRSFNELPSFQDVEWPKLQHLSLYLPSRIDLFFYLWKLPSLVAGLISFKFQVKVLQARDINGTVEQVANLLAERSPKLRDVSFYRSPLPPPQVFLDSVLVPRMLSKLPAVQRLHIGVGDAVVTPSYLGQRLSGQMFDSIQSIDAGTCGMQLVDLGSFADSMPNLTYLRVKFNIPDEGGRHMACNTGYEQPLELHVPSIWFDSAEPEDVWENVSKYALVQIGVSLSLEN